MTRIWGGAGNPISATDRGQGKQKEVITTMK